MTNIASGVLRGAWGVEPSSASASFHSLPTGYQVKRGDPGTSVNTLVSAPYVTREYQICLKCHSDYGYSDNNQYPGGNRPLLGRTGGTPPGSNNLTQYTNQAKEFQTPIGHRGEVTTARFRGGIELLDQQPPFLASGDRPDRAQRRQRDRLSRALEQCRRHADHVLQRLPCYRRRGGG